MKSWELIKAIEDGKTIKHINSSTILYYKREIYRILDNINDPLLNPDEWEIVESKKKVILYRHWYKDDKGNIGHIDRSLTWENIMIEMSLNRYDKYTLIKSTIIEEFEIDE